jgi:hypothetical protein
MPAPSRAARLVLACFGITGAFAVAAQAQVASDSCAAAPAITPSTTPYVGTSAGATTDGASTCAGSADVWFRFDAPDDGMALIDTCGSSFNTVLSLHSGCPGDTANQLACSDNETTFGPCAGAGATTSFLCARVSAGESYFIRIAGASGATGAFQLKLTFAPGSGITVINHGFQLSDGLGTATPTWLFTMARAIQKRVPCSQVAVYEPSLQQFLVGTFSAGGAWQPTANPLVIDPAQETILIFDWAIESGGFFKNDYRYRGWSEAAGDALLAALVRLTGNVTALDDYAWHFIGHSRGAVVNSETIERLAAYGVAVDQMTMLDPHDFDQSGVPFDEDWMDWVLGLPQGPGNTWPSSWGFTTWSNIAHSDNFYSTESTSVVPDGRPSGSLARELNVGALSPATIDHSRVHAWYHGTADLTATSDGDGLSIQANWYPGGERTTDGWNHARLGGRARPAPNNGLLAYGPVWQPLANGVFNGDFQLRSPFKPDPIPGWYLHGGDQMEDTLLTEGGGNVYLQLNAGNPIATHNLLAVPPDATHLRMRFLTDVALRDSTTPEVFLAAELTGRWAKPVTHSRGSLWTWTDIELTPAEKGAAILVVVMLPQGATSIGVDDLQFVALTPPCDCPGNADGSATVDFEDITAALANWGATYPGSSGPGDADCSGTVDFDDITSTLTNWNAACP